MTHWYGNEAYAIVLLNWSKWREVSDEGVIIVDGAILS